jgi:tight adherence protein B
VTVNPLLLTALAFAAGALVVAAGYSILSDLVLRDRSRIGKRVDEALRLRQRERARQSALFKDLGSLPPDLGAAEEERPTWRHQFVAMVEQSGLDLAPSRLLLYMAAAGVGGGGLVFALGAGAVAAVLVALALAAGPFLYVWLKRRARLHKLMSQLPDAFELMSRVIRAGQTMSQALLAVADEFDAPVSAEFSYCYEQQNLGLSPELAMRDLARRTGLLEIKIFVLALLIQQQAGGNLAELLDRLANIIRERFRIVGKIRTLTAEGRMQAAVLLAVPPALFLIILVLNRPYAQVLLDYPIILGAVLVSELIGALWIRRIVNFDF